MAMRDLTSSLLATLLLHSLGASVGEILEELRGLNDMMDPIRIGPENSLRDSSASAAAIIVKGGSL
jgi:hypothetical protein